MLKMKNILIVLFVTVAISTGGIFSLLQGDSLPSSAMHDENPKILGHVEYKVFGPDGKIKEYLQADNLVVNNGDNATVNKVFGVSRTTTSATINPFIAIAVGTGNTSPVTTNTALGTQQGHKIIATTDISAATHGQVKLTGVFNPGQITNSSSQIITESGVFDNTASTLNSNSTNMYARQTFSGITIASSDTLQVTWNITIT
jgi:hypothetical protein